MVLNRQYMDSNPNDLMGIFVAEKRDAVVTPQDRKNFYKRMKVELLRQGKITLSR